MNSATNDLSNAPAEHGMAFLAAITRAYLWVATWAERNVEAGEDGLKIPSEVRRIIENRNFYV